jgi:hypothetical protein
VRQEVVLDKRALISLRGRSARVGRLVACALLALLLAATPASAVDGCTVPGFPEWAERGLDYIFIGACTRHDQCYQECNPMYGPYFGIGHKEGCDVAFSAEMFVACTIWAGISTYPIGWIQNPDDFIRYCSEVLIPGSFAIFQLPVAFSAWHTDQKYIGCNPNEWGLSAATLVQACVPCTEWCWGAYCPPPECYSDSDCVYLYCNGNFSDCSMACSGGVCRYSSPIVVDVEGKGYELTDAKGGVRFDLTGHGRQKFSWTSPRKGNAWLALDRDGNGTIDDGSELFGSYTLQPRDQEGPANGFRALAVYDLAENGGDDDGRIGRGDRVYGELRLWVDANQNGLSEPAELHTLTEFGIVAIDLAYKLSERTDRNGNRFRFRGDIIERDGAPHGRTIWDVVLLREQ